MVLFTIWLVLAIVFFFLTNKSINSNAGNISYKRNAVLVTCILIGLLWPLFIILAIIIWFIQISRARKVLKEIDDKLSSVFKSKNDFYKNMHYCNEVSKKINTEENN